MGSDAGGDGAEGPPFLFCSVGSAPLAIDARFQGFLVNVVGVIPVVGSVGLIASKDSLYKKPCRIPPHCKKWVSRVSNTPVIEWSHLDFSVARRSSNSQRPDCKLLNILSDRVYQATSYQSPKLHLILLSSLYQAASYQSPKTTPHSTPTPHSISNLYKAASYQSPQTTPHSVIQPLSSGQLSKYENYESLDIRSLSRSVCSLAGGYSGYPAPLTRYTGGHETRDRCSHKGPYRYARHVPSAAGGHWAQASNKDAQPQKVGEATQRIGCDDLGAGLGNTNHEFMRTWW